MKFSKQAIKFLESLEHIKRERIRTKIKKLAFTIIEEGMIPFRELQIKTLEGEWKGFMRMRAGKIRIIFRIDKEQDEILIYEIDYRGDAYK
jgi:mRNA interferase RelE/StbE